MVQVDNENNIPLLRRAFSISKIIDENHYELLIQQVGTGTTILRNKLVGQKLGVLGPLGSSFNIQMAKDKEVSIVAGGIGIAPVFFLYNSLKDIARNITIYYGAQSKDNIVDLSELNTKNADIKISTEDGTHGYKGYVTQLLLKDMQSESFNQCNTVIYSCGPTPMLSALEKVVNGSGVFCEISVETMMACGIGVCMGCPVELKEEPCKYVYACKDGPVFNINDIVIE